MTNQRALACVAAAFLAFGAAACGKQEDSGGGGSAASPDEVKAGPGVTADTITVGELSDLSGVFAPLATAFTQAQELYFKEVNAQGGICDRQVKLRVEDPGYDVQKAVSLYRDMEPDVAMISQMVGSPIISALRKSLEQDSMLTLAAAWPPVFLEVEQLGIIGATYDIEAINGLDWMMKEKGLKKGDKIGHLYFEGDFGEGALIGSKYFAEQMGMELVEQKIKATDEDMSAAASAFKRAGVSAVFVTTAPGQLASLAGVMKAIGLNVPIGTSGPVFAPQLLDTQVGGVLDAQVTVFNSSASYASDAASDIAAKYEEAYPKGIPQQAVTVGWAEAEIAKQALEKACENGDLSREGIVAAFRQLSGVDTGGLVAGSLDFSKVGETSSRAVYAHDVDKDAKGGLTTLGEPIESELAQGYTLSE